MSKKSKQASEKSRQKKKIPLYSKRTYVFKENLLKDPVTITTILAERGYITFIETLPVHTFRGGAYKRDILQIHETKEEALKYHAEVCEGKQ